MSWIDKERNPDGSFKAQRYDALGLLEEATRIMQAPDWKEKVEEIMHRAKYYAALRSVLAQAVSRRLEDA